MRNKTSFHELILECPLMFPLENCPYNDFRKMSLTELIEYNRQDYSDEKKELFKEHKKCLRARKLKKKKKR